MSENEKIEFNWPETGKLKIRFEKNGSLSLKFFPSTAAIVKGFREAVKRPSAAHQTDRQSNTKKP